MYKSKPEEYPLLYLNRSSSKIQIFNEFVAVQNFYRDSESKQIEVEYIGDYEMRGKVRESPEQDGVVFLCEHAETIHFGFINTRETVFAHVKDFQLVLMRTSQDKFIKYAPFRVPALAAAFFGTIVGLICCAAAFLKFRKIREERNFAMAGGAQFNERLNPI